jgi:hypothetical protein
MTNEPAFHPHTASTPAHDKSHPDITQNTPLNLFEGQTLANPTNTDLTNSPYVLPKVKFNFHFTKNPSNSQSGPPNLTQSIQ